MNDKETRRTIVLTDRRPISVVSERWPEIAGAWGADKHSNSPSLQAQAEQQRNVRRYALQVLSHDDGRRIVLGVTHGRHDEDDIKHGELIGHDTEMTDGEIDAATVANIREVGDRCEMPARIIRNAIEDLPPERIE